MPNQGAGLDLVFRALSNPTRRGVVDRLSKGPVAMSELAKGSRMALPSFLQHLNVLERAGLVSSNKAGRVRTYELQSEPLSPAGDWIDGHRARWEKRLDQLDSYLKGQRETEG